MAFTGTLELDLDIIKRLDVDDIINLLNIDDNKYNINLTLQDAIFRDPNHNALLVIWFLENREDIDIMNHITNVDYWEIVKLYNRSRC